MGENIFEDITFSKSEKKTFDELRIIPKDEWGHKFVLISSDEARKIDELSKILSKELVLANIKDDFYITLINERFGLTIIPFFQIYERSGDNVTKEFMEWFFARTLVELKTTRSKGGFERSLQALIPPKEEEKKRGFALTRAEKKETNEGAVYE